MFFSDSEESSQEESSSANEKEKKKKLDSSLSKSGFSMTTGNVNIIITQSYELEKALKYIEDIK